MNFGKRVARAQRVLSALDRLTQCSDLISDYDFQQVNTQGLLNANGRLLCAGVKNFRAGDYVGTSTLAEATKMCSDMGAAFALTK